MTGRRCRNGPHRSDRRRLPSPSPVYGSRDRSRNRRSGSGPYAWIRGYSTPPRGPHGSRSNTGSVPSHAGAPPDSNQRALWFPLHASHNVCHLPPRIRRPHCRKPSGTSGRCRPPPQAPRVNRNSPFRHCTARRNSGSMLSCKCIPINVRNGRHALPCPPVVLSG